MRCIQFGKGADTADPGWARRMHFVFRRDKIRDICHTQLSPWGGGFMKPGAQPLLPVAQERQTASVTPIRPLSLDADAARAGLLRRLAADRLRDLRDDGVTVGYMARIYGVEQGTMEEMIAALGLGPG
jgi:hypothetical protein